MFHRNVVMPRLFAGLIACALLSCAAAYSQQGDSSSQPQDESTTVDGTIVSSSGHTLLVKSDDNQSHTFTWDRDTKKPEVLEAGARVRVASDEGDDEDTPVATNVTVLSQPQSGDSANSSVRDAAPVPQQVKGVEKKIERDARRWRLGVRGGVGLDPELVLFGVHSQIGPVFSKNVFFRPNADFEWGEVTDMVALNFEGVYRIPSARRAKWAPYLGGGPSMNFIHQSFQTQKGQGRNISFGDFDYETGFNILAGFQDRHGTFFEVKTALYSQPAPVLRLIVGRNF